MDVLELARKRRAALVSELERLDALLDSGEPSEPQADHAQIIPFPQKQPRILRQYTSRRP